MYFTRMLLVQYCYSYISDLLIGEGLKVATTRLAMKLYLGQLAMIENTIKWVNNLFF